MNEANSDHPLDSLRTIRRTCIIVGSIAAALVLSSFISFGDRTSTQFAHVDPLFATEAPHPPVPTLNDLGVLAELDLDEAFWECDHTAARHGVDATDAVRCQRVYETFKRLRFGGDIDALGTWWRTHREAQYARLDRLPR